MKIKERPEWSEKYPAIDGIAKDKKHQGDYVIPGQKPIRSDIEEILRLSNDEFEKWYKTRKEATEKLLKDYEVFGSIPDLRYGSEEQKDDISSASTFIANHIEVLKNGLEYLDIIKKVREENK